MDQGASPDEARIFLRKVGINVALNTANFLIDSLKPYRLCTRRSQMHSNCGNRAHLDNCHSERSEESLRTHV